MLEVSFCVLEVSRVLEVSCVRSIILCVRGITCD